MIGLLSAGVRKEIDIGDIVSRARRQREFVRQIERVEREYAEISCLRMHLDRGEADVALRLKDGLRAGETDEEVLEIGIEHAEHGCRGEVGVTLIDAAAEDEIVVVIENLVRVRQLLLRSEGLGMSRRVRGGSIGEAVAEIGDRLAVVCKLDNRLEWRRRSRWSASMRFLEFRLDRRNRSISASLPST